MFNSDGDSEEDVDALRAAAAAVEAMVGGHGRSGPEGDRVSHGRILLPPSDENEPHQGGGSRETERSSGENFDPRANGRGKKKAEGKGGNPRSDPSVEMIPFGWNLYFSEPFSDANHVLSIIERFLDFFQSQSVLNPSVDFADLRSFFEEDPSFVEYILSNPHEALPCCGLAAFQLHYQDVSDISQCSKVEVRIRNLTPITRLQKLKSMHIGSLICVQGTVVRVGSIRPLVEELDFICGHCAFSWAKRFVDGIFDPPLNCPECRGRAIAPNRSSAKLMDAQRLRIQQLSSQEPGRIPRTLECEVLGDLCSSAVPGDVVEVVGSVKVLRSDRAPAEQKNIFVLYMTVNSITNLKRADVLPAFPPARRSLDEKPLFSEKDIAFIRKLKEVPDLLRLCVGSICPGILGHELIKAGMLFSMFGGVTKFEGDPQRTNVRGDSHVLIVGDPGMGKSQMLQACVQAAPRGVYVSGQTSSATGLSVMVNRDPVTGEWALEAGALALADQGVCCIDEFDKMSSQHVVLLEAMEQQSVSIAKAGISCSLPARAAVISAANPVGGSYDKSRSVAENLKVSPALLSRFDLVFVLLDKPDEDRDMILSRHVLNLHGASDVKAITSSEAFPEIADREEDLIAKREALLSVIPEHERTISQRLMGPIPQNEVIPKALLKKYITYAKTRVIPRLTKEATREIEKYYLHRRLSDKAASPRLLSSLVRLTEARARIELRDEATREDAMDVIEILDASFGDVFSESSMSVSSTQTRRRSKMKDIKRLVAHLNNVSFRSRNPLFHVSELRSAARDVGVEVDPQMLELLNSQGYLLAKGNSFYKLNTSSVGV